MELILVEDEIEALSPVKVSSLTRASLIILTITLKLIWVPLIFGALHVLVYYVYSVCTNGFLNPESLKYGAMVAVGAYFCVIIDKHKIEDILNVKKVDKKLPFILNECTEESDLNQKEHLLDFLGK